MTRWLRRAHRPGRPWSHLAVLARTNSRLDPVARALARAGIPYRMSGGAKEAAQARTVLAELRRVPKTRHLRSALAELVMARESEASLETHDPPDDEQGGSFLGLPVALARLADEHALESPDATVGEFLEWVAAGGEGAMELDAPDGVELSTFHRAKGLEWPAVAIVGLEDGMVPIAYARTPDAVAEERRLLYVALTRAEDELWCSWAGTRRVAGRTWRCDPSRLLDAVTKANLELGAESEPDARRLSERIGLLRGPAAPGRLSPGTGTGEAGPAALPVDVDEHRGVVRGLFALAGVAVDERVGDALGEGAAEHDEVDAQAHVLVEVPGAVVPPREELALRVPEPEGVDQPPLLQFVQRDRARERSRVSPPRRQPGPTRRGLRERR